MNQKLLELHRDTLFRNSFYLMLSTGIMAVLGFFFWLINARLFNPSQIGIATTLIAAMNLISYVALLGFNNTFVRFLPNSKNRNNEINTGLVLSISAAVIAAIVYVLIIPFVAPKLSLVHQNFWYGLGFVAMVALAAINLLTDSIFIAFRAAKYNLLIDGIVMSSVKLALPFMLVGLGAFGVFTASASAASIAMLLSIYFLVVKFDYHPKLRVDIHTLRDVFHYSFSNYIANLLNIAPMLVLPIIVLNHLGAPDAGYFYIAFMVANLLYTVAYAVTQSLFAEGAYADRALGDLLKKSLTVITLIILPGTVMLYFGAHIILEAYGHAYAKEATGILQALAMAAPAVALYAISGVLLRISKQVYALIIMNVIYFVTICGLALFWANRGLTWIGYAWIIGQLFSGVAGLIFFVYQRRQNLSMLGASERAY